MANTFFIECSVCGKIYENWSGSTYCCGGMSLVVSEVRFRKEKILKIVNNIKNCK